MATRTELANGSSDYEAAQRLVAANSANPARELEILEDEAIDFVRRNRRAIKALAITLAERGELSQNELRAAIQAARNENSCL